MAHYTIYIPNIQGSNDDNLRKVGLGDLCADRGADWWECLKGPDGARGMCATWSTGNPLSDPPFSIHPNQTWKKHEALDYWLGWETDRPPKPNDLKRRKKLFEGYPIKLRDENVWEVPAVVNLPNKIGMGKNGETALFIEDKYKDFSKRADKMAQHIFTGLDFLDEMGALKFPKEPDDAIREITIMDGATFASEALALNYRLTHDLCLMLELFDQQNLSMILMSIISLPEILVTRDEKKKVEYVAIPVG